MSNPKYKNIGTPETKLIEECSELIKIICKAQRFGWKNHHPDRQTTNWEEAMNEFADVVESWMALEKLVEGKP